MHLNCWQRNRTTLHEHSIPGRKVTTIAGERLWQNLARNSAVTQLQLSPFRKAVHKFYCLIIQIVNSKQISNILPGIKVRKEQNKQAENVFQRVSYFKVPKWRLWPDSTPNIDALLILWQAGKVGTPPVPLGFPRKGQEGTHKHNNVINFINCQCRESTPVPALPYTALHYLSTLRNLQFSSSVQFIKVWTDL